MGDQPLEELQLVPLIETDRLEADPFRIPFWVKKWPPFSPPPLVLGGTFKLVFRGGVPSGKLT